MGLPRLTVCTEKGGIGKTAVVHLEFEQEIFAGEGILGERDVIRPRHRFGLTDGGHVLELYTIARARPNEFPDHAPRRLVAGGYLRHLLPEDLPGAIGLRK